jgi:hypothetical protein
MRMLPLAIFSNSIHVPTGSWVRSGKSTGIVAVKRASGRAGGRLTRSGAGGRVIFSNILIFRYLNGTMEGY